MNIFLKISLNFMVLALVVTAGIIPSRAEDETALSGKVIETMDSGGYTYVQIENNGGKTWVAIPKTKIVKDQDISFAPGAEMQNFESKSLMRTFDSIIFSGGVIGQKVDSEIKSAGSTVSAVAVTENITVDKATGPDAYTVAEIFQKSKELQEKIVVVRGKVVKVSAGIMGKNWIHLQDGTGDAGNNDLVFTSTDLPKVGDVVTASGTLYNNKDFGGGYKYKVIIEKTDIKKEDTGSNKEAVPIKN